MGEDVLLLGWVELGVMGLSASDNSEAIVKAEGLDLLAGGLTGLGGVVGRGEDNKWHGEGALQSFCDEGRLSTKESSWQSSESSSGPSPTTSISGSGLPLALYSRRSCSMVT